MIAVRLVRLIEDHSDELADRLLLRFQTSPNTADLNKVPTPELRNRISEILRNLGNWLLSKSGTDIAVHYRRIGALRASQDVSSAHVAWGIVLMKEEIWGFLQRQGFLLGPVELYGEMELLRLLDQFFDHAICYCIEGYENVRENNVEKASRAHRKIPAAVGD